MGEKHSGRVDMKIKKSKDRSKIQAHILQPFIYTLINDFEKVQQYLRREDEETINKVLLKTVFAGMGESFPLLTARKGTKQTNATTQPTIHPIALERKCRR